MVTQEKLQLVTDLCNEACHKIQDREPIGYANGLKAAVTHIRLGESLDEAVVYLLERCNFGQIIHFAPDGSVPYEIMPKDPYDVGFMRALLKAKEIIEG